MARANVRFVIEYRPAININGTDPIGSSDRTTVDQGGSRPSTGGMELPERCHETESNNSQAFLVSSGSLWLIPYSTSSLLNAGRLRRV